MREDQGSIAAWADATFGPVASIAHSLCVANEKVAALIRELCDGEDSPSIVDDAAAVVIALYRTGELLRISLDDAAQGVPETYVYGRSPLALASMAGEAVTKTIAAGRSFGEETVPSWTASAQLSRALVFCRRIAALSGDDMGEAIDRVMKRNRAQRWTRDGKGFGAPLLQGENIDEAAAEIATAIGLDWTLLDEAEPVGEEWNMGAAQNVTRESFRSLARAAVERAPQSPLLSFVYTNWRGETERRRVRLLGLRRGSTPWHPEPQLLMRGYCLDHGAERDFALEGIRGMG